MSGRFLVLCSGQGGQHPGMFDLVRGHPAAATLVPNSLAAATLFDNQVAQPMLARSALATWAAVRDRLPAPDLCAGYSIGELIAYGVAGAVDPAACVELAAQRAAIMDACVTEPQGMLAVSDRDVALVRCMAEKFGCTPAIVNDIDRCVVGGPTASLDLLAAHAQEQGARCQRLRVNVASHTPLLAGAVVPFRAALEAASMIAPDCPVIGGIDASRVTRADDALDHLSRQLAQPILWTDCMDACAESGAEVALELGPCPALSSMLRSRHPHIACRSSSEFRSLDGLVAWVQRALDA
jgi:[acyl-carrier-protein] S-malonyltransferase